MIRILRKHNRRIPADFRQIGVNGPAQLRHLCVQIVPFLHIPVFGLHGLHEHLTHGGFIHADFRGKIFKSVGRLLILLGISSQGIEAAEKQQQQRAANIGNE